MAEEVKVAGMHLWTVGIGYGSSLLVTTFLKSWQHAVSKAQKLVTNKASDFYGSEIKSITYSGVIDAQVGFGMKMQMPNV